MTDQYVSLASLTAAISALRGTADAMLKVWLTLKAMGLTEETSVAVDTGNPQPFVARLFGFSDAAYFVPFADTNRHLFMAGEVSRSQIQTNIKKFHDQTVSYDPRSYLKIGQRPDSKWDVSCQPGYPQGLGYGVDGFARGDAQQVSLPIRCWAVWYGRRTPIPNTESDPIGYLVRDMLAELNISTAEKAVIFRDDPLFIPTFAASPVDDDELRDLLHGVRDGEVPELPTFVVDEQQYLRRLASIRTATAGPRWLASDPAQRLKDVVASGAKAVLLYGPPRTGKTKAIDDLVARASPNRATIQIHDGWSYEHLMLGIKASGSTFDWKPGPLLTAIQAKKNFIVLEEANRTQLAQALGEVFSLLENKYRGEANNMSMRDGSSFYIPEETLFIFSMNTLDNSVEEIDDALLGRMASIEFPPRVEDAREILSASKFDEDQIDRISEFYAGVLSKYPLGHGYFANMLPGSNLIQHYVNHIRPVIQKRFRHDAATLTAIDLLADEFLQ